MDIRSLDGSFFAPSKLQNLARDKTAREDLVAETGAPLKSVVRGNAFEEKNYAKIHLAGMQTETAQKTRQTALLNAPLDQLSETDSYAASALAGRKAARAIMREMQQTVVEESEHNLDEVRKAIAAKTQETVETKPAADPRAASQAVQDEATADATAASSSATATPETQSGLAAPVTPSISITV